MKHRLILLLALAATLTACGRQTPPAPGGAAANPGTSAATGAAAAPAGTASSVALAAQALKTQEAADTGTAADSGTTKLERVVSLPPQGQLPAGQWVAGKNYQPLVPAQPSNAPAGKVEVTEVFWYACPHCYALEPYLRKWARTKPDYIQFDHVPVMWSDVHRATARLYYTLQALGKEDQLRESVFDEIHQKRDPLVATTDGTTVDAAGTLRLQTAFAKAHGISEQDFVSAYNSFAVQTDLQRAEDLGERYKVEGVPLIVIDGKYETDVGMAGSEENLIKVIDFLAASEKNR